MRNKRIQAVSSLSILPDLQVHFIALIHAATRRIHIQHQPLVGIIFYHAVDIFQDILLIVIFVRIADSPFDIEDGDMIFMDGCRIRLVLIQPGKSCDFQQDPQRSTPARKLPKQAKTGWFFTPSRCPVIPLPCGMPFLARHRSFALISSLFWF